MIFSLLINKHNKHRVYTILKLKLPEEHFDMRYSFFLIRRKRQLKIIEF